MSQKCIFLDRDGVLNEDDVNYTWKLSRFRILPGVPEALYRLREAGYLLVVVTNQSGIAQGFYTQRDMQICHIFLQDKVEHVIEKFYFAPGHQKFSASLARKPGTLMFEKAIARFDIDISLSWMIGDRGRDIIPARLLGLRTIQIGDDIEPSAAADFAVAGLLEASSVILGMAPVKRGEAV